MFVRTARGKTGVILMGLWAISVLMPVAARTQPVELITTGDDVVVEYTAETDSYYRIHSRPLLDRGAWTARRFDLVTNDVQSWIHNTVLSSTQTFFYKIERVLLTNALDYDLDGLNDVYELNDSTVDPMDPDGDDDLLLDGDEVLTYYSSPVDPDTDGDHVADGDEVTLFGTAPASAFSGATILYPFATNTEDWGAETGAYGQASISWTNAGIPSAGALVVTPAAGSGYGDYYVRDGALHDNRSVVPRPIYRAWVYLPGDAPEGSVSVQLWVKSTADGWAAHYDASFHDAVPGAWTPVSWDMSSLSTQVLADVDEWAVKIAWDNRSTWSGPVFLDSVHLLPHPPSTNLPPLVTGVTPASSTVGRYEKFELTVGLTNVAGLNPYDPADVNLEAVFISPSSETWTIWGFYMEEPEDAYGEGSWKVRFAPDRAGVWKYSVRVSNTWGTNTSPTSTFTCVTGTRHGWLRVSDDDPHYFEQDDGTAFYGIGYCRPYDIAEEGIFADAAEHGINMLHVWMAPWDTLLTVEGVEPGRESSSFYTYEQGRARSIDRMIAYAEQYAVKLVFTIWTHDALRDFNHHSWRKNGSWAHAFDEKVDEPEQYVNAFCRLDDPPQNQKFFRDPKYWKYQEQLYRYIIARWGYSEAIGLWQLASELYGTYADSLKCVRWQDPEFVTNKNALVGRDPYENMDTNQVDGADHTLPWIEFIHGYFATNDPFVHPTTACNETDQYWDDGFAVLDVPQIHSYAESYSWVTPAITLARYHHRLHDGFDKPAFIGETGTWKWRSYQPDFIRTTAWPALCAGAAITPMMWTVPAFGQYCDPVMGPWLDGMSDEAALFARFVAGIDFPRLHLHPATVSA
ncbi:MAG: DUF5060 domain-containing protein, partial [Kiritimatiellae bacterium]|nr:DUF5060 domain-containing protein [Kiritimatiellia bacterium]